MRKLDDAIKIFIVHRLGEFKSYQHVAGLVKKHFGIEIPRQQVYLYTTDRVSEKWQQELKRHRKAFLKDLDSIPISNKAVRLQHLDEQLSRIEQQLRSVDNGQTLTHQGRKKSRDVELTQTLLELIKQAQDEMEGRKPSIHLQQAMVGGQPLTSERREAIIERLRNAFNKG